MRIDDEGAVQPDDENPGRATRRAACKIVFAGSDGEERTLYYFSTNLSDEGVKNSSS